MNTKLEKKVSKGFTLIELLIVVIIVAILAAVVIPQFNDSSLEAKEANLDANLSAMRSAIELYKLQHNGKNPGATTAVAATPCTAGTGTGAAGTDVAFKEQLTMPTNEKGETCKIADATYRYGPYLKTGVPADPLLNSTAVDVKNTGAPLAPTAEVGGWQYDIKSGQFVTNNNTNDSKGRPYSSH